MCGFLFSMTSFSPLMPWVVSSFLMRKALSLAIFWIVLQISTVAFLVWENGKIEGSLQPLNWNNSVAAIMSPPVSLTPKMRWRHAGTATATTTKNSAAIPVKGRVLITAWLENDRNNVVQTPGELKISTAVRLFQEVVFWTWTAHKCQKRNGLC